MFLTFSSPGDFEGLRLALGTGDAYGLVGTFGNILQFLVLWREISHPSIETILHRLKPFRAFGSV